MDMIPVFKPLLEKEEKEACVEVLDIGWLGMGKNVGEFEEAVKQFINCKDRYVVAVSTGHAAIHLSLLIAGVGYGDEVITPSFNNTADFQAILATGAKPVLCDISDDSLCIDLDKAESLITEKTKAMIVMDYDCLLCDHDRVQAIADKYNLRIIHDAAHSFGSKYNGKMVGSFSDICIFSFDPVKTITCLDGGIIIVKSEEEYNNLKELRLVGMTQPSSTMYQNQRAWTYDVKQLGFRYHMSNMHAAMGLKQLSKIDKISQSRREACRYYNEQLKNIKEVRVPNTDYTDITPFLYYIRVPKETRDSLRTFMLSQGVDTGIHWQPGHWFTLLKDCKKGDLTVTESVGREILSLPLHSMMPRETLDRVISSIKNYFGGDRYGK